MLDTNIFDDFEVYFIWIISKLNESNQLDMQDLSVRSLRRIRQGGCLIELTAAQFDLFTAVRRGGGKLFLIFWHFPLKSNNLLILNVIKRVQRRQVGR